MGTALLDDCDIRSDMPGLDHVLLGAAIARPEQPTDDEGVMRIKSPGTALNTRRTGRLRHRIASTDDRHYSERHMSVDKVDWGRARWHGEP